MYNSMQYFCEVGIGKIEDKIKDFLIEQKDIGDIVFGLQDNLFEEIKKRSINAYTTAQKF